MSYGLDPSIVCVRRAKLTYGAAVLNRFVRGRHPESKMLRQEGVEWCRDVFDCFVVADQLVRRGETVVRRYAPAGVRQDHIAVGIYSSESSSPKYTTDPGVSKCATVSLQLGERVAVRKRRTIEMAMFFGDTEIKITALDVATRQSVNATIDFVNG